MIRVILDVATVDRTVHENKTVVCLCATLSQALIMGIAQGFGVFVPVLMDEFNSSREHTGKLFVYVQIRNLHTVKQRNFGHG